MTESISNDWYQIKQVQPSLLQITEPGHVSFFVLKQADYALFIDSGLGLDEALAKDLLKRLGVERFDVLLTHTHTDHVGLNYLADRVYCNRLEWDKYIRQDGIEHAGIYYDLLKGILPWPSVLSEKPVQKPWEPTDYFEGQDNLKIGPWSFQTFPGPGHTCGSVVFYEASLNILFLGDFFYNGILYINLSDSSIGDFEEFFLKLKAWILKQDPRPLLLPSHNDIPLDPGYLDRLEVFMNDVKRDAVADKKRWTFGRFFEPSTIFSRGDTRMVIRDDQLKLWQAQGIGDI